MPLGVCMVIDYFHPDVGGAQTYALTLAQALISKDVDVFVVTRSIQGCPSSEVVQRVPVYRVGNDSAGSKAARSLSFTLEALKLLKRFRGRYQVIHSHKVISPATIGLIAHELYGKPLLIQPHSTSHAGALSDMLYRRRATDPLRLKWMRHRADCFVAISRQVFSDIRLFHVPEQKIVFIPNGIDTDAFRPGNAESAAIVRRQLALGDETVVGFVGRLDEVKRIDTLLRAWHLLGDAVGGARLLIVGDGPERKRLEDLAGDLGIADRVVFAGSSQNVERFLNVMDVFVMPSRAESFGLALIEAMASGLPCLASRVGGMIDIIQPENNGLFFAAGDVTALAEQLGRLLRDDDLRARLASQARSDAVERYSLNRAADAFVDTYRQLVGGQPFSHASIAGQES